MSSVAHTGESCVNRRTVQYMYQSQQIRCHTMYSFFSNCCFISYFSNAVTCSCCSHANVNGEFTAKQKRSKQRKTKLPNEWRECVYVEVTWLRFIETAAERQIVLFAAKTKTSAWRMDTPSPGWRTRFASYTNLN